MNGLSGGDFFLVLIMKVAIIFAFAFIIGAIKAGLKKSFNSAYEPSQSAESAAPSSYNEEVPKKEWDTMSLNFMKTFGAYNGMRLFTIFSQFFYDESVSSTSRLFVKINEAFANDPLHGEAMVVRFFTISYELLDSGDLSPAKVAVIRANHSDIMEILKEGRNSKSA
jgi:hypothetical protein